MRIGEIIGKVTLSRCHPSLSGATLRLVVPLTADGLQAVHTETGDRTTGRGEPLVCWDDLSAGNGSIIAFTESAEASAPFHPEQKPINAYNAAILDQLHLQP